MSANWFTCSPLVEDVVGEVEVDSVAVLVCDGTNEDAISVEELQVDWVRVYIVGVIEEERIQSRGAGLALFVNGSVDVVDFLLVSDLVSAKDVKAIRLTKLVSDGDAISCGLSHGGPAIEFLGNGGNVGMIPEEGVEGSKGGPSMENG